MLSSSTAFRRIFPLANAGGDTASWKRQTVFAALFVLAATLVLARTRIAFFPLHQIQSQDVLPLIVLSVSLLVVVFFAPRATLPARLPNLLWLATAGFAVVGIMVFGAYEVLVNFPLSADERMVAFDMAVFEQMRLAAPVAEAWSPYAKALIPAFLLVEDMPKGLASAYLPMNALLRMAFSRIADPALFNPLLALTGGAALLDIARRTFGRQDSACWVVLLVYVLSAQMLVNAMTPYSMTAHMALNLIWMSGFLRGGWRWHLVAIVTGFVATGLHQIAFHPIFVAPFLLWKLRDGHWRLVLTYGVAYSAILLWWLYYPMLVGQEVVSALQQQPNTSFIQRVVNAFAERRGDTIGTMFMNLLRFVAWQNVALLPLLLASVALARRNGGLPAVLLLGILGWLSFIAIVIPFQGHGWGYRYLHPYLGIFALLAGYGYHELKAVIGTRADGLVLALSGVTALATIPLLFVAAHRFVAPYVELDAVIAAQPTPMVLIDTGHRPTNDGRWAGNAIETVRNSPDLENRPIRLSSAQMNVRLVSELCRRGEITTVGGADQHRTGFAPNKSGNSAAFERLTSAVRREMPGCLMPATGLSE